MHFESFMVMLSKTVGKAVKLGQYFMETEYEHARPACANRLGRYWDGYVDHDELAVAAPLHWIDCELSACAHAVRCNHSGDEVGVIQACCYVLCSPASSVRKCWCCRHHAYCRAKCDTCFAVILPVRGMTWRLGLTLQFITWSDGSGFV